ncbi:MAG: hypothetical protein R8G01_03215 [Ilumatobacteraceae bacterium]|nr:hypothetical protein [Ilumatobacteraceae bacterium]
MTPRLVSFVLAAALLTGACSSSDDAASTTPPPSVAGTQPGTTAPPSTAADSTTTTSAPTTTAPPTSSSSTSPPTSVATTTSSVATTPTTTEAADFTDAEQADRDVARTALITLSVFPDGWVEDPVEDDAADDDGSDSEFEAQFDTCLGRDGEDQVGDEIDRLKVSTGDFHPIDDDATTVAHEVVLAPDVDTALDAMAEVRVDGAESCLADVIGEFYRTTFARDPDLADVGIGDVLVTRTEGDRDPDVAVGVLLEVPLTIGDQTVSQFLELLYQRQGRALSELSFSSFGSRFDRDGYTVLSDEVVIRLATIGN